MKFLLAGLVLIVGFATALSGAEIKVMLNPENQNVSDALIVVFPKKIKVTKGQTSLKYEILNRSTEDIFVVVESKNVEGWKDLKGPTGIMGGGGRSIGMECTHESLRLLYAPRRFPDGTLMSGEVEMMSGTVAKVNVDAGPDKDLSNWIGAKGTLRLFFKYYVGNSKDRRMVEISVPVEIQEANKAAHPTAKTHQIESKLEGAAGWPIRSARNNMPYFRSSQASGPYHGRMPQLLQAFGAWTLTVGVLAVLCMAAAGGRFVVTWHSGAAAGPILALVPESFLDAGILTVILYSISLGAAVLFQFLRFSWLWLGGWIGSGIIVLLMRLAYHFST